MKEQNSIIVNCSCKSCGSQLLRAELPEVSCASPASGTYINGIYIKGCPYCSGDGQKSQPTEPPEPTARCDQWWDRMKRSEILKRRDEAAQKAIDEQNKKVLSFANSYFWLNGEYPPDDKIMQFKERFMKEQNEKEPTK